jgi:chromosome segregation ATPase
MMVQRLQNELKEGQDNKHSLKSRLEDYEDKIKKMIREFEEESKRHIKEVNDVHFQYRGYKTKAQELDQRIEQFKKEAQRAAASERKAVKSAKQLTFQCDELDEKLMYMEQKYHALIKRMGASQQDIDRIEEEIMFKNPASDPSKKGSYSYEGFAGKSGNERVSSGYNYNR